MKNEATTVQNQLSELPNAISFLEPFVAACGCTLPDVARALGLSRQIVQHWKKTGDIKISHIYKFAELKGYDCRMYLIPQDKDYGDNSIYESLNITDSDLTENLTLRKLFFLKAAMRRDGIKMKTLAETDKKTYQAILTAFNNDDMMFSRIINYADIFHWNIHCKFIPKEREKIHVPKKRGVCYVEIFKEF